MRMLQLLVFCPKTIIDHGGPPAINDQRHHHHTSAPEAFILHIKYIRIAELEGNKVVQIIKLNRPSGYYDKRARYAQTQLETHVHTHRNTCNKSNKWHRP